MAELLPGTDLGQLDRQATDLLQAARSGDPEAAARLGAVSGDPSVESARLAVATECGFASWADLATEVERRAILDTRDLPRLTALLADRPELAVERLRHWCDHRGGASPLGYLAMLRYDTMRGVWRDVPGTGEIARALLDAGAPVEGDPADAETPLMTAASYGDAEVAQALVAAGADLTATASAGAGGVPGGTALRHAAVFGMTAVEEVLLAAGARDLVQAAKAGDVSGLLTADTPEADRVAALRIAAEHGRLDVMDRLLDAATPVDGVDGDGSTALHAAAYNGQPGSVRLLLARGADPMPRDRRFDGTALDWCRHRRDQVGPGAGHDEVERLLLPHTPEAR